MRSKLRPFQDPVKNLFWIRQLVWYQRRRRYGSHIVSACLSLFILEKINVSKSFKGNVIIGVENPSGTTCSIWEPIAIVATIRRSVVVANKVNEGLWNIVLNGDK